MANESKLGIILDAKDRASRVIKGVGGNLSRFKSKLQGVQGELRTVRNVSSIAFGAIATGAVLAVNASGDAEGAMNKFNTVFGEQREGMISWVDDIRQEMPTARDQIIRMSADLQDLLIPMGLSREEATGMSKSFIGLSNKVAAFNDVPVSRVLEAMRSGLVGSSEPLKKFGIEARITTLETVALNEGLLEAGKTFNDLEPQVRSQVQAQALLIQATNNSSDAINGFSDNQDSYLRRSQDLKATLDELVVAIGDSLIGAFDRALIALLPMIKAMRDFIEEHPKLTRAIIIVTGALAGFLVIISSLSLALIVINPIVALITAGILLLVAAGVLIVTKWEKISRFFKDTWEGIRLIFSSAIDDIMDKLEPFINIFNTLMSGLKSLSGISGTLGSIAYNTGEFRSNQSTRGFTEKEPYTIPEGDYGDPLDSTAVGIQYGKNNYFDFRNANISDKENFVRDIKRSINRDTMLTNQGIN